jgi:DNA-binding XRE family transcriptional regulator
MLLSLAAARVNANMTQRAAAKAIGVSRYSIMNWENGKTSPSVTQLKALCREYGIDIDDLFLPAILPKVEQI